MKKFSELSKAKRSHYYNRAKKGLRSVYEGVYAKDSSCPPSEKAWHVDVAMDILADKGEIWKEAETLYEMDIARKEEKKCKKLYQRVKVFFMNRYKSLRVATLIEQGKSKKDAERISDTEMSAQLRCGHFDQQTELLFEGRFPGLRLEKEGKKVVIVQDPSWAEDLGDSAKPI